MIEVEIEGLGGNFHPVQASLFCGNAGTTVRFLSAFCALVPGAQVITGDQRMQARPIRDLVDALTGLGVDIAVRQRLPSCDRTIRCPAWWSCPGAGKSQQPVPVRYTHGCALCTATDQSRGGGRDGVRDLCRIDPRGDGEPLASLVDRPDRRRFHIPQQCYQGRNFAIEGDATSAGYWWALAASTAGRVTVKNIQPSSHQGDMELLPILERMGCTITRQQGVTVQGPGRLKSPGVVDMNRLPDGVMTLAVLAALAQGETRIVNVANLRIKESDRLAALVTELRRIGIEAEELPDGIRIRGGEPHSADIETYADHRMAMSFAILGARVPGIRIGTPECVSKSYPTFFEELQALYPSHRGC